MSTQQEMEIDDLTDLLQDFYNHAKPRLKVVGHGESYSFKELNPDLYDRLDKVIDMGEEKQRGYQYG